MDRDAAMLHTSIYGAGLHNAAVQEDESNRELPSPSSSRGSQKTRRIDDILNPQDHQQHFHFVAPISSVPYSGKPMMYSYMASLPTKDDSNPMEKVGPAMIFLPSHPTKKEWTNIVAATKSGFALTGSAAMGQVGPVIGLMDIGECDDSYLFRVSLPGVKRDESKLLIRTKKITYDIAALRGSCKISLGLRFCVMHSKYMKLLLFILHYIFYRFRKS